MALESLIDALRSDADRDVRRIEETARREAAHIRADAEALVARRCAAAAAAREAELRITSDARLAHARREDRQQSLHAREAFLQAVFSAAEARLPFVLDAPERGAALQRLVAEALQFVSGGNAVVRCRAGLAARLLSSAATLGARVVADDTVPEGVIVTSSDGAVAIDNTLIARLRWQRNAFAIALLERLTTTA